MWHVPVHEFAVEITSQQVIHKLALARLATFLDRLIFENQIIVPPALDGETA